MYLYNVTFMVEREAEAGLMAWLRDDASVIRAVDGREHRIMKVVAVPDDPEFGRQALSVSLQVEFSSLGLARDWGRELLPPVTESFHTTQGGQALHFATILKQV
ncbi:MAG: DUF4286 family protein [Muribaculaceae bacterium]|nr:DUF4286 family protein [Muribaculaceae bacterium]